MLVIMLLIQPRTFFLGGAGGTSGLLGRRGMIGGASGGASIIGVGSRPWLQKIAALTVAVSLTIATADTFKVAQRQYEANYMNAGDLRDEVVRSLEIRISRVVSDIFLWLAQVQTLIRLFPRHKEKVMIKWIGFALIILDMTFNCLNSFMGHNGAGRPRRFVDAIPALSYLFQLALSMLYAAWVLYYAITKKQYAFYHKLMWNISLVAILSVVAVLTPVVFFITDISDTTVSGWGDYFRWVGAAAASVIVWEWVERIEALEREEKKDGILGREIFDGDEMLDVSASEEVSWPRSRYQQHDPDYPRGGGGAGVRASGVEKDPHGVFHRMVHTSRLNWKMGHSAPPSVSKEANLSDRRLLSVSSAEPSPGTISGLYGPVPTPPPAVASPISRADTTSAGSTVYAIRYHTINEPAPPLMRQQSNRPPTRGTLDDEPIDPEAQIRKTDPPRHMSNRALRWQAANPFRRRKASPPPEVRSGRVVSTATALKPDEVQQAHEHSRWDLKSRIGALAAEAGDKIRERSTGRQIPVSLPVVVIPAQPRGRTWSPDNLQSQQPDSDPPVNRDSRDSTTSSSGASSNLQYVTRVEDDEGDHPHQLPPVQYTGGRVDIGEETFAPTRTPEAPNGHPRAATNPTDLEKVTEEDPEKVEPPGEPNNTRGDGNR